MPRACCTGLCPLSERLLLLKPSRSPPSQLVCLDPGRTPSPPRGLCPSTFQLEPPLLPPLSTYTCQIVQADRAGVFRGVLGAWTQQRREGKKGAVKGGCTCQGRLPGGGLPRCPPVSPSFPVMAILVLLTRHFDHILPSCQIIS